MPQQATADAGREWAANWSHRIGRAIAHHRKAAGLTAQQLSERCAELGYPISRSAIAGMESARKDAIIVAEVQVIARAIGVTPLRLLFPLGRSEWVEAMPGLKLPPWFEVQWWRGEVPAFGDVAPTLYRFTPDDVDRVIRLFREHDRNVGMLDGIPGVVEDPAQRERLLELARDGLRNLRELMRREGLVPPHLPEGFLSDDKRDGNELEHRYHA